MKLLPNEQKLLSLSSNEIILTDHRIHMTDQVWGQSFSINIFLEDISSIEIKFTHKLFLLILAGLFVFGGYYSSGGFAGSSPMYGGLFFGGICFAIWWFTRKHVVSVSPNGGSPLNFKIRGMDSNAIEEFVYKLSTAKQNRVNQLHKL